MSWETVKLEEICDVIRGVTYSSDQSFNDSSECEDLIPILRAGNIQNQLILDDKLVWVSKDLVKEQQIIKAEDILMCTSSGSSDLVGKNAIADQNWYGSYGAFCANLRNKNKDRLNSKFLYFYLNSDGFSNWTKKSSGANIKNIRISELRDFCAPLPPLHQQQRIADILDKAEAINQKREQALALCDQFLRATFLDMFGDPVSNPKGWEFKDFAELGELNRGKSKHRPRNDPKLLGGDYPLIQTGDVANSKGYITNFTSTYSEFGLKQSKLWSKGTLCITIAANIAKTGILTFDACFPDSVVGFEANDLVTIEYIQSWLGFLQKTLEDQAPESAQKNINLAILKALSIPTPPIELQQKFSSIVEKINGIKTRIQDAQELPLFDALSQQAFKGELTL